MRLFVDPWIRQTGAWFIFVLNFRNAFTLMAVNFAVPVITSRDYGWEQLQNSYIFVALSVESIISTYILQRVSRRVNDRNLMSIWATIAHTGLLAYAVVSSFGTASLPVPVLISTLVWYDFGTSMPPTQSLYSKLIGKACAFESYALHRRGSGILASCPLLSLPGQRWLVLLRSAGQWCPGQRNFRRGSCSTVAQSTCTALLGTGAALAGQLVGFAYGSLGPPALWGLVQLIWVISWIILFFMWRRLHPAAWSYWAHMMLGRLLEWASRACLPEAYVREMHAKLYHEFEPSSTTVSLQGAA